MLGTPGKENFPPSEDKVEPAFHPQEGLISCYPNPFGEEVAVSVYLEHPQHLSLAVYDLNGRRIGVIADRETDAGNHLFHWKCRGNTGRCLHYPAGNPGIQSIILK